MDIAVEAEVAINDPDAINNRRTMAIVFPFTEFTSRMNTANLTKQQIY